MQYTIDNKAHVEEILQMIENSAEDFLAKFYRDGGLYFDDFYGEYRRPYRSKKLVKERLIFSDIYEYDYIPIRDILEDVIRNNNRTHNVGISKTVVFIKNIYENRDSIRKYDIFVDMNPEELHIIDLLRRYYATLNKNKIN